MKISAGAVIGLVLCLGASACGDDGAADDATVDASTGSGDGAEASTGAPETGLDADESGTTGPVAICGDGFVEGDEVCDDANPVDGDGCNVDCFESGSLRWSVTLEDDSRKVRSGRAVVVAAGDTIVVQQNTADEQLGPETGYWIAGLDAADGTEAWRTTIEGYGGAVPRSTIVAVGDDRVVVAEASGEGPRLAMYEAGALVWRSTALGEQVWMASMSATERPVAGIVVATASAGMDHQLLQYDLQGEVVETIALPPPEPPATLNTFEFVARDGDITYVAGAEIARGLFQPAFRAYEGASLSWGYVDAISAGVGYQAMALDPNGDPWLHDSERLVRPGPDGRTVIVDTGYTAARDLVIDADGNLLRVVVVEDIGAQLEKRSVDMEVSWTVAVNTLVSLAVTRPGDAVVADSDGMAITVRAFRP